MATNLDRFRSDLTSLLERGDNLLHAMYYECLKEDFEKQMKEAYKNKAAEKIKALPNFKTHYQHWYSESLVLLKQRLPDRVEDFVRHYQKPKGRKEIDFENYRIEDYLQGLQVTRGVYKELVVDGSAAIPQFQQ